jgi:hypothetical protein
MTSKADMFRRDRKRMLGLLRELETRLVEVPLEAIPENIIPLIQEIDDTDLAIKLGFRASPFIYCPRQLRTTRDEIVIYNDPFEFGNGELLLRVTTRLGNRYRSYNRVEKEEFEFIKRIVGRWKRAVSILSEPETYPAMPPYYDPTVPRDLWVDPLWRELHLTAGAIRRGDPLLWTESADQPLGSMIRKILRLIRSHDLPAHVPFTWDGSTTAVHDPNGLKVAAIEIVDGYLVRPPRETLGRIVDALIAWRDVRGDQVAPSGLFWEGIVLHEEDQTVSVDGAIEPLSGDQARIVKLLIQARGGWVVGEKMKTQPGSEERPDRIIKRLPDRLRVRIEGKRGLGYRLLASE